ncbi:hypothetical protein ACKLNR_013953 [Fusarium oxysporum f. sp. zingiberi]
MQAESAPVPDQAPAQEQVSASFRQSKICICVDVSGSTYGPTLTAEIKAVKQVCSLIPQSMHGNITIIPWNDAPERPRPLSQIHTLESGGGTDPNVLLEDPECRILLQEADFWFLMTDGVINSSVVSQKVGKDEVILQGDTRVNISNLVSRETIDEDLMRHIMLNEDNIKTIALTAKLRGESDKLIKWLDKVDAKIERDSMNEGTGHKGSQLLKDTESELVGLDGSHSSSGANTAMEYDAQHAYAPKFPSIHKGYCYPSSYPTVPSASSEAIEAVRSSSAVMRSISDSSCLVETPSIGSSKFKHLYSVKPSSESSLLHRGRPVKGKLPSASWKRIQLPLIPSFSRNKKKPQWYDHPAELSNKNQDDNLNLAITGFLKPTEAKDQYFLDCPKCGKARAVMALLLRARDQSIATKNLPPINSTSKLVYPLTMGNYPETDIISNTVVCDSCAAAMVKASMTLLEETIVAALPLVSYNKNQEAWLQTINIATDRRFYRSDLPQVFLSIIYTKIERLLSETSKFPGLQDALRWEANMIQCEVVIQSEKFLHADQLGAGLMHEVILRNFRDSLLHDKFPLLLSYPLDGFIVANAALSNSRYSRVLIPTKRRAVVLLRFLYHLLENCRAYEQDNGSIQLHTAKTLILLRDDPNGPRSLFKWGSLRNFSFHFDTIQDLRRYLSSHAIMDRYRLSLTMADLLDTPLLTAAGLAAFRRLGPLFSWIESEAGNSIAVFVHYLMRLDIAPCVPSVQFQKLRERQELKEALADPGSLSARTVERLIKPLPVHFFTLMGEFEIPQQGPKITNGRLSKKEKVKKRKPNMAKAGPKRQNSTPRGRRVLKRLNIRRKWIPETDE